jgi:hypothetical protein
VKAQRKRVFTHRAKQYTVLLSPHHSGTNTHTLGLDLVLEIHLHKTKMTTQLTTCKNNKNNNKNTMMDPACPFKQSSDYFVSS